jgi:cytochrome c-type biogenesis protein
MVSMQNVIASGQLWLAIPLALLAGLVSFASPCVLPLVPGYLGYLGGAADPARRRLVAGVALFILGFAVLFAAYGALFGSLGAWLLRWQDPLIRVLGVVVILMGLLFVGLFGWLQRSLKVSFRPRASLIGAPVLGFVFGLGWTPCLGPTLASISVLSLNSGSAARGALLTLIYAMGLGVPFLLIALGFGWATRATSFLRRHIRAVNLAGGITMIGIGVLMVTGVWTALMYAIQPLIGGTVLPI